MKKRLLTGIGLLFIDLGIFAVAYTLLPRPGSITYFGAWDHFVKRVYHWDIAWGAFIAALLISVGIFLILEAFGKFSKD